MKQIKYLPLAVLATVMSSVAAYAVGLSTSWTETRLTHEQCMRRAEIAMRDSDFYEVEFVGQSVFGDYREYTGTIRCVTSKGIIFFVVAGPSSDRASSLRSRLVKNF